MRIFLQFNFQIKPSTDCDRMVYTRWNKAPAHCISTKATLDGIKKNIYNIVDYGIRMLVFYVVCVFVCVCLCVYTVHCTFSLINGTLFLFWRILYLYYCIRTVRTVTIKVESNVRTKIQHKQREKS